MGRKPQRLIEEDKPLTSAWLWSWGLAALIALNIGVWWGYWHG